MNSIFLLSTLIFTQAFSLPTNLSRSITSKAFCEIENTQFLKEDYELLYNNFSLFIDHMKTDENFAELVAHSENEFLSDIAIKDRYCSAPPSYRDPRKHQTKRHDKVYFQFVKEYYDLLKEQYGELLDRYPDFGNFLRGMNALDVISKKIFTQALELLEKDIPGIKNSMFGNSNELTVISKIVRYEKSEKWGTSPHFDKSGLSLIWDSNDADNDCLLICQESNSPSISGLIKPERTYSHQEGKTSALLITGLALPAIGIEINPTLHGVAPIKSEYRYAVISFLLVPHLDMTHMKTDFIE